MELKVLYIIWKEKFGFFHSFLLVFLILTLHSKISNTAPAHHSTLRMDEKKQIPTTAVSIIENATDVYNETFHRLNMQIRNENVDKKDNNTLTLHLNDSSSLKRVIQMPINSTNASVIDELKKSLIDDEGKDPFNKTNIYTPAAIFESNKEEDLKYSEHFTNETANMAKVRELSSPNDKVIDFHYLKDVQPDNGSTIHWKTQFQDTQAKNESNNKNDIPAHLKTTEKSMFRTKELAMHFKENIKVHFDSNHKSMDDTGINLELNQVDKTKWHTGNSTRRIIKTKKDRDKIVKLIDLEDHDENNNGKTLSLENSGHDGVKITKKKQLIATHDDSTSDILKNSPENTFVSKNKINSLIPVRNGFSDPILMNKTVPVPQNGSNHQPMNRPFVEKMVTNFMQQTTAGTTEMNKPVNTPSNTLLSSTVFQVPDFKTTPTRLPNNFQPQEFSIGSKSNNTRKQEEGKFKNDQQTESKISDIQIEVYDSTVDSIVSSTNFRETDGSLFEFGVNSTKPPLSPLSQEKFTQYVVDHADYSTEESTMGIISIASGRPEPAAIEIHINVSEGLGNDSEDLEFSYRQTDVSSKPLLGRNSSVSSSVPKEISERSEEVLVVEVIDTGDNNTETSGSIENLNVNPIFTFRSSADIIKDIDGNNTSEEKNLKPRVSDDLFLPDVRKEEINYLHSPPPQPTSPKTLLPDRDSDTIFYISNTEVKVAESLPAINANFDQQLKHNRLENQFFPVNYVSSTHPNSINKERYHLEEENTQSQIHTTKNGINIFNQIENIPPLDVTYVGESIMEVEQSSDIESVTSPSSMSPTESREVIIQPAILPEISIGVPIIGELPPQIELKALDFVPDETTGQRGNEIERIESSIQYGGDLINEGGVLSGGGFDSVVGSYPFGNQENLEREKSNSDFTQIFINTGTSHFKNDQLVADVASFVESTVENVTMRELYKNGTELIANGTIESAERIGNATTFSILEDVSPETNSEINWNDWKTLFLACFATLLPLVVAVFLVFGLRYLYHKYQVTVLEQNYCSNELTNEKSDTDSPDEHTSQRSKTEILPTIASTDVIIESIVHNQKNSRDQIYIPSNVNYVPTEKPSENIAVMHDFSLNDSSNSIFRSYTGPNGSITTMTLKHNHLIVETEERNDISRDARETKMHYNTAEKDGIFVVEVSRGIDSKSMTDSPDVGNNQRLLGIGRMQIESPLSAGSQDKIMIKNHEEVQIHQPPLEQLKVNNTEDLQMILHQIVEVEEPIPSPSSIVDHKYVADEYRCKQSNIGLSQSDISSTSSADSNKRYSYGNQELYSLEHPDHATKSLIVQLPLTGIRHSEPTDDDHTSENGNNMDRTTNNSQTTDNCQVISQKTVSNGKEAETTSCNPIQEKRNETVKNNEELEHINIESHDKEPVGNTNLISGNNILCESSRTNGSGGMDKNAYDSMVSLPDPPSTEEINKLNELSLMESNQLDSLPPPSPPPPMVISTDVSTLKECAKYGNIFHIENKELIRTLPSGPTDFSCTDNIPLASLIPHSSPTLRSHLNNGRNANLTSIALAVDVNGS